MAIVVFMDGVVRNDNRVPIFEGLVLYRALNENGTVVFACDDQTEAARWCAEHKVKDVDGYLSDDKVANLDNKDFLKVQRQQATGPVEFVVTSDVDLATTCLENGIKTLLFLQPTYLSAKFRPDGRTGKQSWESLVSEMDKQLNLRMEDKRL